MFMTLLKDLKKWANAVEALQVTEEMRIHLKGLYSVAEENSKYVSAYKFTYDVEGISVAGFLIAPKTRSNQRMPMIIFNRGGTGDYDLVPDHRLFTSLATMARWGYVVVGSQYPGNSLSEGRDERGGKSDLDSVLSLYDLAQSVNCIDEHRIGMYGFSRGGMMTYLCMKSVDWIKAAVVVGGLTDLDSSLKHRPAIEKVMSNSFDNTQAERDRRSVIKWTNKLNKVPLCILHGGADKKINPADAIHLANALKKIHFPHELHIFKDGDHSLANVGQEKNRIIKAWFSKYLGT